MNPELARAFAALTTGIYVLTVREGMQRHGMSSSWVTQVSGDPALLMAAVDRRHITHGVIERTGEFALHVLGQKSSHLEEYFYSPASRRPDNLDTVGCDDSPDGLPQLRDAMVSLECRVCDRHVACDHTLFIATVARVTWRHTDRPLTSQDLEYVYVGEVVQRQRG